ncbi:hypothetical protein E2562_030406 [Oryza meyeriana var. granulata]|uniref:DUF834 domain-containing protein n=1 Tax=Oryza meyeriana var. granulata TaxID=110450 RepID=A0A6G1FE21_9ORYZ|nr:hypothetical protein E2562_030406 [Oryza meyeriana var. granulata]
MTSYGQAAVDLDGSGGGDSSQKLGPEVPLRGDRVGGGGTRWEPGGIPRFGFRRSSVGGAGWSADDGGGGRGCRLGAHGC